MAEYSEENKGSEAKGSEADPKDDSDILEECREGLKNVISDEDDNRDAMMDDLRFCTLDQWPEEIRKEREDTTQDGGARPCLTIDKINQYIVQVVNDMRQGKPGINVRPVDDGADVETAKILKGLVRNIEDQSNADIAYATGGESQCRIGLGYWRVTTEYISPDSFDQEIFIRPIPNTFSTYLGPHIFPDGSDAKKGWIIEEMPVEKFKREYPGKKYTTADFSDINGWEYWCSEETITVVEYFYIQSKRTRLFFLADGTTITESDYDKWPLEAGVKPTVQDERVTFIEQLKWCKMTGAQILEKRDLPGKYIPIVEVVGRESFVEGRRLLWGLVRPAKDSLRMYNYWASTITEKMGLAPKSPYLGAKGQFAGVEDKWKKANKTNYSYLEYEPIEINGNAVPPPQRVGPTPMESALVQHMQVIEHDVQTSLGMFKAATGESESQQSGRAILALQRESDTGTYHFGANQGISIRHTGRIIVDLIPHYYDTKRVVRILGEDGTHQTVTIDPNQEQAHRKIDEGAGIKSIYNPGVGKYDVAITVGPSYNTKRMEAAATLTEVVKTQPQLMPLIGDLLFRSLDFPYSDQIAERMKKMLPAPLQDGQDPAHQVMQLTAKLQQIGVAMHELQQENVQLKAGAQEGMAKVQVQAQEAAAKLQQQSQETQAELQLQAQKQAGEIQLAREKAAAEIEIKRAVAEAEHNIKIAELNIEAQATQQKMAMEQDHKKRELDFNMAIKADERQQERESEDKTEAESLAPQLVQTMKAIVDTLAQMQKAIAQPPPRTITAKTSSGQTMSATVQ